MKNKWQIFKFIWHLLRKFKPHLLVVHGLYAAMRTLEMLLVIFIPSNMIQLLMQESEQAAIMLKITAMLAVVWALRIAGRLLQRKATLLGLQFGQDLRKDISFQIMTIPFTQIEDATFISKKEEALFPLETQNVLHNLFTALPSVIQAIALMTTVLSILLVYDVVIVLVVIVLASVSFQFSQSMIQKEAESAKRSARQNNEYVYYLRTIRDLAIAKDVRIYQMQPFFVQKLKALFDYYVGSIKELYQSREYRALVNQLLSVSLTVFVYGYLLYRIFQVQMGSAIFVLLVNATVSFSDQINVFLTELLVLNQQLIYLKPLQEFYEMITAKEKKGSILLTDPIVSVEFRNVTFRYPNTEQLVLNQCSFQIDCKKNLSIVGLNGSGKTTMIKLLSRLYEPIEGAILVNGVTIQEYEEQSYLKQLSIIFQDFKTFHYSMKENIIYDREADETNLQEALIRSEYEKETGKFKHGIDTYLSSDFGEGTSISKGQEQKLVIARSIYQGGSLMILDEPTAALDPIAEEEVYRHFRSITNDKLAIFISHRLSSCRFSDVIIYLENGSVQEQGTHEELMLLGGKYASIFQMQAAKYQLA